MFVFKNMGRFLSLEQVVYNEYAHDVGCIGLLVSGFPPVYVVI